MIKNKIIKTLALIVAVLLVIVIAVAAVLFFPLMGEKHLDVWSSGQPFDISKISTVEKQADKGFKILLLTDTQLWMNNGDNKACYEQIEELVEQTKPDMLATVGDNVSGITSRFLVKDFIEVMDSFELPWTVVYGNHDSEIPMTSLNWQSEKYMESEYCLLEKGPSNLYGSGNYVVNITENGTPIYSLFMFDNGRYTKYSKDVTKEIYMGYEQIAWYEWNVNGIAQSVGKTVPSMTFSHFALPEFREAVEKLGVREDEKSPYIIPQEYGFGECDYLPGVAPVDSGFVDKCKELGSTKYIFCGHDHENNASVTSEGVTMTYGLKTGPSPRPWNNAKKTGGTLVTIGNEESNYGVSIDHIVIKQ